MSFSASVSHNDDILFTFCPTEVDWLEKVVIFHYLITTVDCLPERGPHVTSVLLLLHSESSGKAVLTKKVAKMISTIISTMTSELSSLQNIAPYPSHSGINQLECLRPWRESNIPKPVSSSNSRRETWTSSVLYGRLLAHQAALNLSLHVHKGVSSLTFKMYACGMFLHYNCHDKWKEIMRDTYLLVPVLI